MDFKIGNCRVCISPLFAVMLCVILLVDRTGIMLFGLLSVAIHETGHLVFMYLTRKYPEKVVFQLGGIIIKSRGFSDYNCDFLVALGGCLFNLIAFLISGFAYYQIRNEMLLVFAAGNFGLMLFNLVPVNGLDGMDLIKLSLLKKYRPEKVKSICNAISVSFLIVSLLISVYAVFYLGLNPTIIVCLLYLVVLTLLNIKNESS